MYVCDDLARGWTIQLEGSIWVAPARSQSWGWMDGWIN